MARDGSDSWDIDESVGATALGTAAVRAYELNAESPLFHDPFAHLFLDAVAQAGSTVQYGGKRPAEFSETDPNLAAFVQTMTNFAAARTKFFDDFAATATDSGVRQFVFLAAGLDTRAWRLENLADAVVFEIDQPGVLGFKADVLTRAAVAPVSTYVPVPVDLRKNWPNKLQQNGFDDSQPTGWLIEGLLPYLPPVAQITLFDHVCQLSAPGSRIVVDGYRPEFFEKKALRASFDQMARGAGSAGSDSEDRIYSEELFFTGDRPDVAESLSAQGWFTTGERSIDVMARFGRPAAPSVDRASLGSDFIAAVLPG